MDYIDALVVVKEPVDGLIKEVAQLWRSLGLPSAVATERVAEIRAHFEVSAQPILAAERAVAEKAQGELDKAREDAMRVASEVGEELRENEQLAILVRIEEMEKEKTRLEPFRERRNEELTELKERIARECEWMGVDVSPYSVAEDQQGALGCKTARQRLGRLESLQDGRVQEASKARARIKGIGNKIGGALEFRVAHEGELTGSDDGVVVLERTAENKRFVQEVKEFEDATGREVLTSGRFNAHLERLEEEYLEYQSPNGHVKRKPKSEPVVNGRAAATKEVKKRSGSESRSDSESEAPADRKGGAKAAQSEDSRGGGAHKKDDQSPLRRDSRRGGDAPRSGERRTVVAAAKLADQPEPGRGGQRDRNGRAPPGRFSQSRSRSPAGEPARQATNGDFRRGGDSRRGGGGRMRENDGDRDAPRDDRRSGVARGRRDEDENVRGRGAAGGRAGGRAREEEECQTDERNPRRGRIASVPTPCDDRGGGESPPRRRRRVAVVAREDVQAREGGRGARSPEPQRRPVRDVREDSREPQRPRDSREPRGGAEDQREPRGGGQRRRRDQYDGDVAEEPMPRRQNAPPQQDRKRGGRCDDASPPPERDRKNGGGCEDVSPPPESDRRAGRGGGDDESPPPVREQQNRPSGEARGGGRGEARDAPARDAPARDEQEPREVQKPRGGGEGVPHRRRRRTDLVEDDR